jgi:oxygen-independent coproporphyrinogen-3 oxidase
VDLIYGLPRQTLDGFDRTLTEVIALAPDRVAVYGYAHLPSMFKAQQQIEAAELPDPATRLALFGRALERLTAAGYVYIGMDHFARADDELARAQRAGQLQRNFQGYSTHGECDIVGLGVSAIGRIGDNYSQNARDLTGYYAALDAGRLPVARGLHLDEDDVIRRAAIGELMCHGELDMAVFGLRHRLIFATYFAQALERLRALADDGLVTLDARMIRVTSRGRLLLRIIAMCFDAYLDDDASPVRYSRAI